MDRCPLGGREGTAPWRGVRGNLYDGDRFGAWVSTGREQPNRRHRVGRHRRNSQLWVTPRNRWTTLSILCRDILGWRDNNIIRRERVRFGRLKWFFSQFALGRQSLCPWVGLKCWLWLQNMSRSGSVPTSIRVQGGLGAGSDREIRNLRGDEKFSERLQDTYRVSIHAHQEKQHIRTHTYIPWVNGEKKPISVAIVRITKRYELWR